MSISGNSVSYREDAPQVRSYEPETMRFAASKLAMKEYKHQWYLKNKEKNRGKYKEYHQKNKDQRNKHGREYYSKNKLHIPEKSKEYRKKNRDLILLRKKKYYEENKEKIQAGFKKYREENKEYVFKRDKKRRERNIEFHREKSRKFYKENAEKCKKSSYRYKTNRKKNDINFKLRDVLRTRLYLALRNKSKNGSAVKLLGITIPEFVKYIDELFLSGMSWENHGEWHIDHKKPLASFNLEDPKQLAQACYFKNLQPLWAKDNISKGARLVCQ